MALSQIDHLRGDLLALDNSLSGLGSRMDDQIRGLAAVVQELTAAMGGGGGQPAAAATVDSASPTK
jgi:hypothetical protein